MIGSGVVMEPAWLDRSAYPFEHRYMDVGAGRMHYVDEGQGEPVLFVHGTPTWSFEYRHLIKALSPQMRCIAPDLVGFGLSGRPSSFAYTPEAHAHALAEFVDRLGLERFTLVVHDFGGPVGLPLALDGVGRVSRLVIMNTWMWPDEEMQRAGRLMGGSIGRLLYRYANASLRLIMPRAYGDRKRLTPEIHRQYLEPFRNRNDRVLVLHALAKSLLGSQEFYADSWRRANRLAGRPALIVWGMKDFAFGPRHLARWEQLLPASRVLKLADAGHWPHEEAPEEVAGAIRALSLEPA